MADPQLRLLRYVKDSLTPTMGRLYGDGLVELHTLEPPWINNLPNQSCVPAGWYSTHIGMFKGRYPSLEISNPPAGRSGIEVHAGNEVEETQGCILVGLDRIWTAQGPRLLDSRAALSKLIEWVEAHGQRATLVIAYR